LIFLCACILNELFQLACFYIDNATETTTTLRVSGFAVDLSVDRLSTLFGGFGTIDSVRMMWVGGIASALVRFSSADSVRRAREATVIDGDRTLVCESYVTPPSSSSSTATKESGLADTVQRAAWSAFAQMAISVLRRRNSLPLTELQKHVIELIVADAEAQRRAIEQTLDSFVADADKPLAFRAAAADASQACERLLSLLSTLAINNPTILVCSSCVLVLVYDVVSLS
jgi:hypothetical protein